MRLPMMARYRISNLALLAVVGVLLTACAGDSIKPAALQQTSALRTSPFTPTPAQKALVGVADGTYTFLIDPSQPQALQLGASHLDIPANAVCDLASTSYGPAYWNDSCALQRDTFTVTAVVRNAATDHPSVDFEPALRFSPDASVGLYLYVTNDATLDASRTVKYCNATGCVDESVNDPSVTSSVDLVNRVVFRRIKHFSGFIVLSLTDTVDATLTVF
ncbi:MAG: hypothetical protein HOQ19_15115 [Gemmatimonadaceae bacterium]|nr:hypothetical protein [Gemmatimonadaceae bacterium]